MNPNTLPSKTFNIGPVYHGGTWDGVKRIKMDRGSLGSGAYFTPILSRAEGYASESRGMVVTAFLSLKNPLNIVMQDRREHPCVIALVQLGQPPSKAASLVERVEEKHGYMGSEIKNLGQKQGYDGIVQYVNGKITEIVVWNQEQILVVK